MKRIIIIGGGLSGLAAAYTLEKEGQGEVSWDLYEQADRFGGKFETVKRDGFLIEKGPDSFLARKPAGIELIRELGLTDQLVTNSTGQSFIFHDGKLHPIPEGAVMGIPTDQAALMKSTLVSEAGKMRAVQERDLPFEPLTDDVSLGAFFEQRFGLELVKCLIEPLLSGIYAGNIYQMSLRSTFPQFEEAIQRAGSLMRGLKIPESVQLKTTNTKNTIGAFRTLRNGLADLPAQLVASLPKAHCHTKMSAKQVLQKNGCLEVHFADGTMEECDKVLIAATHDTLTALLDPETTAPLRDEPLATLATISLAYDKKEGFELPEGTGYLVARTKNYATTACTWVEKKWPHMVPDGKMLLRGFVGKAGEELVSQKTDEELVDLVRKDYQEMMGLKETPLFAEVSRMQDAMPSYTVGHKEKLVALSRNLKTRYPGVEFAGMSYQGVGIPDCIALARKKARQLLKEVTE
ncbi:protoporphyrinogen oxidase [Listeria costaricensis]|uniref:protoporphyrinogen oxidase n=1 Tax=Listeria costaricensis TaxID=2026604 RepID=UPI000C080993|nr:protoporphyrinogen oxidase [Listeria costaricensis]